MNQMCQGRKGKGRWVLGTFIKRIKIRANLIQGPFLTVKHKIHIEIFRYVQRTAQPLFVFIRLAPILEWLLCAAA